MSHRIIIGSSRSAADRSQASVQHVDQPASIEITVTYTPTHHQTDNDVLRRQKKIMKLMRQIEDVAIEPSTEDDAADD